MFGAEVLDVGSCAAGGGLGYDCGDFGCIAVGDVDCAAAEEGV